MLSTQLDQYGKTSLTWKHIKAWVMKNGQDLIYWSLTNSFICRQRATGWWLVTGESHKHIDSLMLSNTRAGTVLRCTVRAAQSQQMSCLFWWVKMSLKKQNCVTLPDCWVLKLTNCLIPFPYYFLSYVDYVDTEKLIFF